MTKAVPIAIQEFIEKRKAELRTEIVLTEEAEENRPIMTDLMEWAIRRAIAKELGLDVWYDHAHTVEELDTHGHKRLWWYDVESKSFMAGEGPGKSGHIVSPNEFAKTHRKFIKSHTPVRM